MSIIEEAMPDLAEMARRGGPLWIREAAKIAGVKPRTVRSWIFTGKRGHFLECQIERRIDLANCL